MPKHAKRTHSFRLNVLKNKRPDGKNQYKITFPKQLAENAWAGNEAIFGEFILKRKNQAKEDSLICSLHRFRNESEQYQRKVLNANWSALTCPFCGEEAKPPIFPEGSDPISHQQTHSCGSIYYADRSDRRTAMEWKEISRNKRNWVIIHNYDILTGRTASNLHPDFDVFDNDSRITHVIFLKPQLEIAGNLESLFDM